MKIKVESNQIKSTVILLEYWSGELESVLLKQLQSAFHQGQTLAMFHKTLCCSPRIFQENRQNIL